MWLPSAIVPIAIGSSFYCCYAAPVPNQKDCFTVFWKSGIFAYCEAIHPCINSNCWGAGSIHAPDNFFQSGPLLVPIKMFYICARLGIWAVSKNQAASNKRDGNRFFQHFLCTNWWRVLGYLWLYPRLCNCCHDLCSSCITSLVGSWNIFSPLQLLWQSRPQCLRKMPSSLGTVAVLVAASASNSLVFLQGWVMDGQRFASEPLRVSTTWMVKKHPFEECYLEFKVLFGNLLTALGHHLGLALNQTDQTQKHLPSENDRQMAHF